MSLKNEVNRILRDIENPEGGHVMVIFDERPWYNEDESNKQGRPVFENRVYITKHKDSLSINIERACDEDIARYPKQYEAFEARRKDKQDGIPIGMLPGITPSQTATCEACKVFTVEGLSRVDKALMAVLRLPELKERAAEYLAKGSQVDEMKAEIAQLKAKLAEKDNEPTNNGAKRSRRNSAVRASVSNNNKQQQRSAAST